MGIGNSVTEQPRPPEQPQPQEIRVYYSPETGEVVHVHTLVTPGQYIDSKRIAEEFSPWEESLRERHQSPLEYLTMQGAELRELIRPGIAIRVDVEAKRLVETELPTEPSSENA
jgi:hypothetical protein